jgi:hypothetical protein
MSKLFANVNWKVLASLVGIVVVVALVWNTRVVYPLKILVVFFHEISRFITLSAGYLGSLLWGGLILLLAARTRLDRGVSVVLGGILVLTALLFVRPFAGFGFLFGLLSGVALVGIGLLLPESVNDYLLRVVGLTSCLYAVLDIKSDILDRPELRSDAVMLGELTGLPAIFWGVLWIAVAVLAALYFLLVACKVKPRPARDAGRGKG